MKIKHVVAFGVTAVALSVALHPAQAVDPITEGKQTLAVFLKTDPEMKRFIDTAVGCAVFPSIGKVAVGVGGAHGSGVVFERGGRAVATAKLTQVSVGVQLGGQKFSEVIFFETAKAFSDFMSGDFSLTAGVSAVALAKGAAKTARYQNGVAVFTATTSGLMFEASVGGQKFSVKPL